MLVVNMLNINKNIKLAKDHKLLFCIAVFVLFSAPLRVYGPTSITLEVLIFGLLIYRSNERTKTFDLISSSSFGVIAFFFLYFLMTVLVGYTDDGSGFMNENYRLLLFLLLVTILGTTQLDFFALAKFCLWCCRFHVFFTLFELIYLTILSPGDFYGVPIVGKAMPDLEEGVGYLQENDNIFTFGYRPFGLMLQPQKSGFVFVVGAVLEYIIAQVENRKPSLFWNVAFATIALFQGAKTAFIMLFVLDAAIFFNFYPAKRIYFSSAMFYIACIVAALYIAIQEVSLAEVGNDTNARVLDDVLGFVKFNPVNILVGIGVPSVKEIYSVGGSGESYFMRIFYNFGLPLTLLLFYFMSRCFLPKDRKMKYILIVAFLGMIFHYCVINVYFIDLSFSSAICLALYNEKAIKQ